MIILGLIDSKPSAAAVMIDGKIVAAIAEERLCRKKMATGMPRQAITQVMAEAGISAKDIDLVSVAETVHPGFHAEPVAWSGWFDDRVKTRKLEMHAFEQFSSVVAPVVGNMPIAWEVHHKTKRFISRGRLKKIPTLLQEAYGITAPIRFYDHHYCHATSAYYTSNFDRALVVTLDGGGDGRSGSVYIGENGLLKPLASVDSFHSLGNFYSYITALCGFKAEKHEGKITGLAAVGKPVYADILRGFIGYQEPGQIRYTIPMFHRSALKKIKAKLPTNFDRADLAASVQLVLEEIGTAFVSYWLRHTGMTNVAVAGGVFANVKFNQRIHELDGVTGFFVHPAMDDSGLSVGAGFAAYADQPEIDPTTLIQRLPNVYLGPDYSDEEIEQAIQASGCQARHEPNIHATIASLLAQGHVVARFAGRMEYGPRALGNRTIMYQTTDPSVNDWLNKRLDRTEFMPFAPATLKEYAPECYKNLEGAENPARFMTVTFDCTSKMQGMSPSVVHVDGTARPQLIDRETTPDFYQILTEYHSLTGIPSLINTSFNMHEEPIVCSPEDAIRSFQQGNLDFLAIGNWLISHPVVLEEQATDKVVEQIG